MKGDRQIGMGSISVWPRRACVDVNARWHINGYQWPVATAIHLSLIDDRFEPQTTLQT
jgi:hypothetical protein